MLHLSRTSPVSLQKWMSVRSTTWNILVSDDLNNIYNHLLTAAATCLVTTKNGESRPEFPHASPVSLQKRTIKIRAAQHLLPKITDAVLCSICRLCSIGYQ